MILFYRYILYDTYVAKHSNQDYRITVDSVKVKTIKHNVEQEEGKGKESLSEAGGENERRQQDEPKSLTMAKMLKDNESILKKTKLVEGSKK
jgi:hypothetical protein